MDLVKHAVVSLAVAASLCACAPAAGTSGSSASTPPPEAEAARLSAGSHASSVGPAPASATVASGPISATGAKNGPGMSPAGPTPRASSSPAHEMDGTPGVAATAAPGAPSAAPTATPTAVPYVAPDAPPEIVSFSISAAVVHPGDVLSGSVTASSNVASVEVRVAGYSYVMTKNAPGEFSLAVTVPNVPKMFRRTYPLVAIARNTRGDATQRTTQITIR